MNESLLVSELDGGESERCRAPAAIVDRELTTVGDPLVDLGRLLATWPGADGVGAGTIRVTSFDGFSTAGELLADHAAEAGGRPSAWSRSCGLR